MKVLLYFENEELITKSGIGRAMEHQKIALTSAGVDFTTDPSCRDYDILHINTYGINSTTMVHNAKKMKKKVIYHAHSTEEDFKNSFTLSNVVSPFVKRWLIGLYNQSDVLITPTKYSKHLLRNYGLTKPIFSISNGVDPERFHKDEEKAKIFRDYFHLREDEKVVMGVGLLFARKGIRDFVKVAKAFPDYKFIWFGDISRLIIPFEISEIVENPPANVIFPGYISGDVIEGAYSSASCFFFPSYEETEGIVVLEALSSECPVIVRDIGAFEDWLKDGVNCRKGKNTKDFIRLIHEVTENDSSQLTKNGRATALERTLPIIGSHLKDVYEFTMHMGEE